MLMLQKYHNWWNVIFTLHISIIQDVVQYFSDLIFLNFRKKYVYLFLFMLF